MGHPPVCAWFIWLNTVRSMIKRYHGTYQISNVRPNTIGLCKFKVLTVYIWILNWCEIIRNQSILWSYKLLQIRDFEKWVQKCNQEDFWMILKISWSRIWRTWNNYIQLEIKQETIDQNHKKRRRNALGWTPLFRNINYSGMRKQYLIFSNRVKTYQSISPCV